MSSRVWFISGANAGLGLELSTKAISEGDKVIAGVRNPSRIPDILKGPLVKVIAFDLAWSQEKINEVFATAYEAFGKIDVVVNMAGFAYMGAIEEST
jgi:NAD(P)-dependent dehydrogenase (short-subunit alcohol dehydrogenase family)